MKHNPVFILAILLSSGLSAQSPRFSLSGSVRDTTTGKPVAAVSVFLNGTSKGTTSRDDGTFLLTGIPAGSYQLVASAVGFATFQTSINTNNLPSSLAINLRRQPAELTAVTVKPRPNDGWNKWGGLFWDNFIGTTENASSCTIQNKEVLRFHYNRKFRRLVASAAEPLIVVNDALGYTVEYRLAAFSYDFSDGMVRFYGYLFFREMSPGYAGQQRDWETARQRAYYGSMRHFMRSLYSGRLQKEGFLIKHEVKKPNTEKERVKSMYNPAIGPAATKPAIPADSLRYYRKILREPDTFVRTINNYDTLVTLNPDLTRSFYFTGIFIVGYANARLNIPNTSSSMELTSPVSIQIEENGSYSPLQVLLLKGAWAKTETVSNILPSDYLPPSN